MVHIFGKGPNNSMCGATEMVFLFYFDRRKSLKPEVKIKSMKINGVWQGLTDVYGLKESELNNNEENCCTICFTNPVNTIITPCNHMCLCEFCAKDMIGKTHQCPICRGPIVKIVTLNLKGK